MNFSRNRLGYGICEFLNRTRHNTPTKIQQQEKTLIYDHHSWTVFDDDDDYVDM